jgi:hypothetical protein
VFALSGRGLCDGLISRPEESYRLWCVFECDQVKTETLNTYCEQVGRRGKDYETINIIMIIINIMIILIVTNRMLNHKVSWIRIMFCQCVLSQLTEPHSISVIMWESAKIFRFRRGLYTRCGWPSLL